MNASAASDAGSGNGPGKGLGNPGNGRGRPPGQGPGRVQDRVLTLTGHLPPGTADFVYLPVEVPRGVWRIAIAYTYDQPTVPPGVLGNSCDIGIFDQRGTEPGGPGFRGWSGGARTEFAISAEEATPGYLAGPVEAGTWHVVLGPYTISPQGLRYEVTVTLESGDAGTTREPRYPPVRVAGRGRGWYRGDCHLHTVHSDGGRTLEELAALARAAGLDFINSSEHNTSSAHGLLRPHAGDDLLILTGEEVTTRNGHYLAIGLDGGTWIDWRYRARDGAFDRFAGLIRRAHGIVVPAHPYGASLASQWRFGYEDADAIEVWNGAWTPDDEAALLTWDNLLSAAARRGDGRWVPAMGNSDAHRAPDAVGLPQTVVSAEALDRDALLAGIRAGRTWIAESADIDLAFSVSGPDGEHAGIGERLAVPSDAPVTVRLEVSGAPAGSLARLVTDLGQVLATPLPESGVVEWTTTAAAASYVRAEVRHPPPDWLALLGMPGPAAALTNPIWLDPRPRPDRTPEHATAAAPRGHRP